MPCALSSFRRRGLGAARSRRAGFTLLELLLVLAILGALVAIIAPHVGAGMAGTRLATASRAVLQGARYARTMALLNQTETELVFTSARNDDEDGLVEVRAASVAPPPGGFPDEEAAPAAFGEETEEMAPAEGAPMDAVVEGGSSVAVAAASKDFADEISSTFRCRGVAFAFEGYTDNVDDEAEAAKPAAGEGVEEEFPPIVIRFRSNGACRPFDVRVLCAGGEMHNLVKVGRSGKGKIEGYGEDD